MSGRRVAFDPAGPTRVDLVLVNNPRGELARRSPEIRLAGWAVVCGERELPGAIAWRSPEDCPERPWFAAGSLDALWERWRDLDARPVRLVTNLEVVERLSEVFRGEGRTLAEEIEASGRSVQELAAEYSFPWYESPGGGL